MTDEQRHEARVFFDWMQTQDRASLPTPPIVREIELAKGQEAKRAILDRMMRMIAIVVTEE